MDKDFTEQTKSEEEAAETEFLTAFARVLEKLVHQPSNSEILDIKAASTLLHCSVDTLRRIPSDELPVYRVGKSNLYLKDEVIEFVRTKRVREIPNHLDQESVQFIDELLEDVLDSTTVDVREPSTRKVL